MLTVQPYFRNKPPNVTAVAIGGRFSVHCDIDGRPKPTVTWSDGNLNLIQNISARLYAFPNGTLLISEVTQSDYGIYICHAESKVEVSHKIQLVESMPTDEQDDEIGELLLLYGLSVLWVKFFRGVQWFIFSWHTYLL